MTPRANLSLAELRVLAGLAEGKTLAAIAEECCLGASTMSKAVRAAERHSGLRLLTRAGRRVRLTHEGQAVARKAAAAIAELDQLDQLISRLRVQRAEHLRVLASSTPGNYVLPPLVQEFLRDRPGVEIEIRVVASVDFAPTLAEGYDLGLLASPTRPQLAGWSFEFAYKDELALVARPGIWPASICWADLMHETFVAPFSSPSWTSMWDDIEGKLGLPARRVDIRAVEALKHHVMHQGGVGLVFAGAVQRELAEGKLDQLQVENFRYHIPVFVVSPAGGAKARLAAEFRSFLLARLNVEQDSTVLSELALVR